MRKNPKRDLKPIDFDSRDRENENSVYSFSTQRSAIPSSAISSENSVVFNVQKNRYETSRPQEYNTQKIITKIERAKTPRVHRRQEFPNYPLKSNKKVFGDPFVPRLPQVIHYSKKPSLNYFNDSEEVEPTEIESDLEISMPPNVVLNQATQVDSLELPIPLMMEVTMVGESKLVRSKKVRTLVTLPNDYIDIGIRKDVDKSDEIEKLLNNAFPKDKPIKKKKFASIFLKNEQKVGSTEISPVEIKGRKYKYFNYNFSEKLNDSVKTTDMHTINEKESKNKSNENSNKKTQMLEPEYYEMEISGRKEIFFTTTFSQEPTRKLEISQSFDPFSLLDD